jgi:hypothetical protein
MASFLSSGLEHRLLPDASKHTALYYYFIAYLFISFTSFKLIFKTSRVLKFYLFRQVIRLNRAFHMIDSKVYNNENDLNKIQERSLKMWNELLKDNSSELISCYNSSRRIIKRKNLICILKVTSHESNLVIMQNNGVKLFYDVFIPQSKSTDMAIHFDEIQQRRIDIMIQQEKISIENILDSF